MKEIVNRLHENRQIELAKSILEANGYKVTKKSIVREGHGYTIQDACSDAVDNMDRAMLQEFCRSLVMKCSEKLVKSVTMRLGHSGPDDENDWKSSTITAIDSLDTHSLRELASRLVQSADEATLNKVIKETGHVVESSDMSQSKLSKKFIGPVEDAGYEGKSYRYSYNGIFVLDVTEWEDGVVQVEDINKDIIAFKHNGMSTELKNREFKSIKEFEEFLTKKVLEPIISSEDERFTPISGSEISKDDQQRILDIIYSEAKFWDNAPTPIDVYSEGDSFIVKLGNSNPTYIASLDDKLRKLEDERDIGYESSSNGEGFYGRDYEFFYYKD